MAEVTPGLIVWNRGRISKRALARTDLPRTRMSAEIQENFIPRSLGSMSLRPGLQYIGSVANSSTGLLVPFIRSNTDTALLELTSSQMRIWVDDALLTRANSTAAITLGTFSSSGLTGWTDSDDSGATSEWFTGNYLSLVGTRFARAARRQTVTSSAGTHGLQVVINRGLVNLRVGSSAGGDDYFGEASLRPGTYSLGITSTGNFSIELSANTYYRSLVESVAVESSGNVTLTTPWQSSQFNGLRWDQSGDVIFVAHEDVQQRRIERHSSDSWGVAVYQPEDGPFGSPNVTAKRLQASGLNGNITLSADRPLFDQGHVGALFKLTSAGQKREVTVSGTSQFSDSIKVTGIDDSRQFSVLIVSATGAFDATARVQRSVGEEGSWENIASLVWTASQDTTFNDGLDNQTIYYRIGTGSTYATGSYTATLTYNAGGLAGIARVESVISATESSASVLTSFGSTEFTELWEEGDWQPRLSVGSRNWPSAVRLHEGRLWWGGNNKIWGSVSDAYESFDSEVDGDSAPINRTIAGPAARRVRWMESLGRLIIGTDTRELQAKTGALEEPLTPTNFNLRDLSTQGSANVPAVKIDQRAMFVQAGGTRVMETTYSDSLELQTADRTILVPEIGEPAIGKLVVQRQPDTRVHAVRTDGTVALLVSDPAENVSAWVDVTTSGTVEDAAVLPGTIEDSVYYIVNRTVDSSSVRYIEKWAKESQARGGSSNRMADSFTVYDGTATTLFTNATHLVGSSVIAWGATADLGSYTVSTTGGITLSQASTYTCVGLPYTGWFKSVKLAYGAQFGTPLTQRKKVTHLGLVMADVHAQGLEFGASTGTVDPLPLVEAGATISTDVVNAVYDEPSIPLDGSWNTDSRLVLKANAPRPVTVLGAAISVDTREK